MATRKDVESKITEVKSIVLTTNNMMSLCNNQEMLIEDLKASNEATVKMLEELLELFRAYVNDYVVDLENKLMKGEL